MEASGDYESSARDPVLQACKRGSVPVVYGPDTYADAGAADLWEEQAPFGFGYGIASPFHLPGNLHILVGVDRYDALPKDAAELTRLVSAFHLFATFAQCAAQEVLVERQDEMPPSSPVRLSPRERECLQWAAAGKTAWETGMILSIAEGSVAKFVGAASRKLGCASKSQALVKALRLGLIH